MLIHYEVVFSVRDPQLISKYKAIYYAIRNMEDWRWHAWTYAHEIHQFIILLLISLIISWRYENTFDPAEGWNLIFSKGEGVRAREVVFDRIKQEHAFIMITMYALRNLRDPKEQSFCI